MESTHLLNLSVQVALLKLHLRELQSQKFSYRSMRPKLPRTVRHLQSWWALNCTHIATVGILYLYSPSITKSSVHPSYPHHSRNQPFNYLLKIYCLMFFSSILIVMSINFFAVPYFCDDVLFYWEFLKNQSINQSISQSISQSIDRFYIYPQNVYWAKNNRTKISQESGGAVPSAPPLNLPLFPLKICGKKKI